jgi:RNA polymerase sigma-70 factor (ECF subfamily)
MESLKPITGEDALRKAVETHGPMVLSLAWRIAGERCTAEEVMQDVFVELWRTQTEFASEFHLRCWLRRVATHRATDQLRRRKCQPALIYDERLDERVDERLDTTEENTRSSLGPSGRCEDVPFPAESRLGALLHSLPEAMRAAIVLRYGEEELAPGEIAALLEQPVATVKSNLQRALALLRRKAGMTLKEFVRHA